MNKEDVQKAAELPLFRHASSKQKILEKVAEIDKASEKGWSPIPVIEQRIIQDLSEKGLSSGEIRLRLFEEYGLSRSLYAIRKYKSKQDKAEFD